jgi:phosphoribosylformylglycinamidine cyclo-ligase
MLRTFNCGVGLIAVAGKTKAKRVIAAFNKAGEKAFVMGALVGSKGAEPAVRYRGTLTGA